MPEKKKSTSTANIPRIGVTDLTYPMGDNRRRMEAGYGRAGASSGPHSEDPLEAIKFEKRQDLLREYRDAKAQKEELKLQREVQQMRQEVGSVDISGGGLGIKGLYNFSPQEMQQISRMGEAEQEAFYGTLQRLSTMAAMTPMGGVAGGGTNPLFQLMAMGGFNKQGQGLGMKDVVELGNMWKTVFEGAGQGNQQLTNTLLLELMTKTVPELQVQANQNLQQAYQMQIAQLQANQSDPMRDLEYAKSMSAAMGWAPQAQSSEVAMATLTMQDKWQQKEWEFKMKELGDRKLVGMIDQILKRVDIPSMVRAATRQQTHDMLSPQPPVLPPAERALPPPGVSPPGFMQNPMGMKAPMDSQGPPMGAPPAGGGGRMVIYACQGCGAQMAAPEGGPTVTCTACGKVHRTTYSQG